MRNIIPDEIISGVRDLYLIIYTKLCWLANCIINLSEYYWIITPFYGCNAYVDSLLGSFQNRKVIYAWILIKFFRILSRFISFIIQSCYVISCSSALFPPFIACIRQQRCLSALHLLKSKCLVCMCVCLQSHIIQVFYHYTID